MAAELSRRHLLHTAGIAGALTLAFRGKAFAAPVQPLAEAWVARLAEMARDYRLQTLSGEAWQDAIAALNRRVPLPELFAHIDFASIAAGLQRQALTEHNQTIWIPGLDWKAQRIWTALFILPPGQAVPPHGHNGFVGAHLVLQGRLQVRSFDRVSDEPGRMRLRPRIDAAFAPGETVSMSEDRDNVHWFAADAAGGPVFTFDINVVSTEQRVYANPTGRQGRIYVDPSARRTADGLIDAAVITEAASRPRFGGADAFTQFP
jgi:hypothetical protein